MLIDSVRENKCTLTRTRTVRVPYRKKKQFSLHQDFAHMKCYNDTHTHTHTDRQDSHSKANWLTQNLPNGQNPTESIYHSLIYVFNELIRLR